MNLGIDFGTCFTSAAYVSGRQPISVRFGYNTLSLPSSVYVTSKGTVLVGTEAENQRFENPAMFRRHIKRDLGEDAPYRFGNISLMPEDIVSLLLARVREAAQLQAPEQGAADHAVITIPASYEAPRRDLMLRSARTAGFTNVLLLEEPVAAAMHWLIGPGAATVGDQAVVLVYDLGGGTFDAALVGKNGGKLKILSLPIGNDGLGGILIDDAIVSLVKAARSQVVTSIKQSDATVQRRRMLKLTDECRQLKERLSEIDESKIFFDQTDSNDLGYFTLTQSSLREIIAPIVRDTSDLCNKLLSDGGLLWRDITAVVLVGGSCRIPALRQAIGQLAGKPPVIADDPALAVCFGAARHAENMWSRVAEIAQPARPKQPIGFGRAPGARSMFGGFGRSSPTEEGA